MRTYIFTDRERRLLQIWLENGVREETFDMIIHRIKHFKILENDVKLYHKIKQALIQSPSPQ